ncbi:uncharacterized protein LOC124435433 [Xenia sp. Carnegie-2017]|uniref:uncharacterized protein LOC124435433 n=1 Tax=Xenia sp. Carnegie-2017 TaxID=2897299 RepID=UPI001F042B30|nr:uncharacterized protein LOC124435433 [Xenia sp. Carnegie-2017]
MAPTPATTPPPTNNDSGLTTSAIVLIVIAGYIVIFIIAVFIRQCLLARGVHLCHDWFYELCCTSCSCPRCTCFTHFAELCDFNVPSKNSCLDACCPTKEKCDNMFCCCMNDLPGGDLCADCNGPECQFGDCNCACNCQVPECNSINCICFEIQLRQPAGALNIHQGLQGNIQGQQDYNQYPQTGISNPGQQINYNPQWSNSNPQVSYPAM